MDMFSTSTGAASSGEVTTALFTISVISLGCAAFDGVELPLSLQADNSNNPARLIHIRGMVFISTPYPLS